LTLTNKDITIYIDSNLGEGIKGEEYAKQLYKQGFSKLYLTTGYEAGSFSSMPWLAGVIGKTPPF
jgi:hypothetical protein